MKTTKPKSPKHPSAKSVARQATPPSAFGLAQSAGPKPEIRNPKPEIVLLAVTGMSPAVLTETVWALAHEGEPVIPDRVIVVTTASGRDCLERELLTPLPAFGSRTVWQALRDQIVPAAALLADPTSGSRLHPGVPPLTLESPRVISAPDPTTGRTRELADLRSPSDNEAAADFLLEQVRAIVENPDTRLIASLAGGRKTMGALLYACLTLVGRETDRLTHVLVNEPFENQRGFWFPGQPDSRTESRRQKAATRAAHREACTGSTETPASGHPAKPEPRNPQSDIPVVELADVPFVPLRNLFQRELGRPAGRFAVLVEACREQVRQHAGEQVRLVVEQRRPEIDVNGTRVRLAPREHLVLLFLATRAKRSDPPYLAQKEGLADLNQFRNDLRAAAPVNDFADWRHGDTLKSDVEDQELRRALASLRGKLRVAGGNAYLLVPCLPTKGRFSLAVPGPLIQVKT